MLNLLYLEILLNLSYLLDIEMTKVYGVVPGGGGFVGGGGVLGVGDDAWVASKM